MLSKWLLLLSIDMPLGMISTLQNLGFAVGPAVLAYLKSVRTDQRMLFTTGGDASIVEGTIGLFLIYIVRGRIHEELFWRLYVLLRQILPRPQNPSKVSIQAAENDEFDESESIVGIGRSLGSFTDRRFFGPQSLWPALKVAFPWIGAFNKNKIDKENIKQETLTRCSIIEDDYDYRDRHSGRSMARRAENIISNLESLGVDLEEDFFVDVDQWSHEIDAAGERRAFDAALFFEAESTNHEPSDGRLSFNEDIIASQARPPHTPPAIGNFENMIENVNGSITVEFDVPNHIRREWSEDSRTAPVEVLPFPTTPVDEVTSNTAHPATQSTINLLQSVEDLEATMGQTASNVPATESTSEVERPAVDVALHENIQHPPPGTASGLEQPLTPEPGIRRAISLSHTQTTPRPVRRITETGDDNAEEYLAEVLAGVRRVEAKRKSKDTRQSRVTRVSVFASDSFAWHASTIITSLVLLPLNAVYYRKLTRWFLAMTEGLHASTSMFPKEEMQLAGSSFSWSQGRMVLLSVGIECLLHGVVWSAGCGLARYYGRKYHWGKF